jgi:hypothetical protein
MNRAGGRRNAVQKCGFWWKTPALEISTGNEMPPGVDNNDNALK